MSTVEVKLSEGATIPTKGSEGSAAYDLKCSFEMIVPSFETRIINTGVHMSIPKGYYGQVLSRSGLASKGIIVVGGVIDSDYTGEIKVIIQNLSNLDYIFGKNDKVAQIAIIKLFDGELKIVEELNYTLRNNQGFGSTGK